MKEGSVVEMDLMTPELFKQLCEWIKEGQLIKFYKSKAWKRLRLIALRRDKGKCQECLRNENRLVEANTVHHDKEVRDYPLLALTLSNLESVCKTCHNLKHPNKLKVKPKFTNEEKW